MSFSKDAKEELSKISNLANKKQVEAELIGYLLSSNCSYKNNHIKFATENEYNINRFAKLLNNMNCANYKIDMSGKSFVITFTPVLLEKITIENETIILNNLSNDEILKDKSLQKAFIRGLFLGSGSINNPENKYHLEILFSSEKNSQQLLKLLEQYEIQFKIITKGKNYSAYTKDGEEISKFLALVGANKSVLKYEEIRVYRDMRNNINRKVNCETANLNKTINAAVKQIEAIKALKKAKKLGELSDSLKEIALLRLENPDASLLELGQMLENPIGKSGVNHRLKAIEKLAEELK